MAQEDLARIFAPISDGRITLGMEISRLAVDLMGTLVIDDPNEPRKYILAQGVKTLCSLLFARGPAPTMITTHPELSAAFLRQAGCNDPKIFAAITDKLEFMKSIRPDERIVVLDDGARYYRGWANIIAIDPNNPAVQKYLNDQAYRTGGCPFDQTP